MHHQPAVTLRGMITSFIAAGIAAGLLLSAASQASAAVTADEAKAFVDGAVAHVKAVGPEKAFAEFTAADNTQFHQGELYMFCYGADGMTKAHGGNAKLVGTNMIGMRDADGFLSTAALIKVAMDNGSGWTEIKWPNPVSKKVEKKGVYSVKVADDLVCASGYYKG
ncbi:MAG: cache domain-containing protein [Acetobacteraceae bacterium]